MGDFNRSRKEMDEIEKMTNCTVAQSLNDDNITWQCGQKQSEIDFVLHTGQCERTSAVKTDIKTDHLQLKTRITIEGNKNKVKGKYISKNLKPDLKQR